MNKLKKFAGIFWMLLGPATIYFLIATAIHEINAKPTLDTSIQWGIFIFAFIPIAIGLIFFGWYALQGAYDHLPESSEELD
jgi:hypothetical protein